MDSKIIQFLIQDIIATGEYTLEGIAHHTRIPYDVLFDAACGINHELTITPWARVTSLYIQLKPGVTQALIDKLNEIKTKNQTNLASLLIAR